MKNRLVDLTDHLFCMAERLNDDELSGENLKNEVIKANAMCNVAEKIISTGRLVLDVAKVTHETITEIKHPLLTGVVADAK
jgi:hypothetical protein